MILVFEIFNELVTYNFRLPKAHMASNENNCC